MMSGLWLGDPHFFLCVGDRQMVGGGGNGYFRLLHHQGVCGNKGTSWSSYCWLWLWMLMKVNLGSHFFGRSLSLSNKHPAMFNGTVCPGHSSWTYWGCLLVDWGLWVFLNSNSPRWRKCVCSLISLSQDPALTGSSNSFCRRDSRYPSPSPRGWRNSPVRTAKRTVW